MNDVSERVFVALGSNLGDRLQRLTQGRNGLDALPGTRIIAESSIEETAPIGPPGQGPYLNQMVLLETTQSPRDLLKHCQTIEHDAGRVRAERWGARTLDLDIVRYGDLVIQSDDLTLPHPELSNRMFWQREIREIENRHA